MNHKPWPTMLSSKLRPSRGLEFSIPRECFICRAQLAGRFHSYTKLRQQEKSTPPSGEPSSAPTNTASPTRRQRTAQALRSIQNLDKKPVGLRGGQFRGGSSPSLNVRTGEPVFGNVPTFGIDEHNTDASFEDSCPQPEFTITRVAYGRDDEGERRPEPNLRITRVASGRDRNDESRPEPRFRITKVTFGRDHDDTRRPVSARPRRGGTPARGPRPSRPNAPRDIEDKNDPSPFESKGTDGGLSEDDPTHPDYINNLIESGLIKKPEFKPLDLTTQTLVTNRIAHAAGEEGVRSEMLAAMGRLARRPNLDWTVDADLARRLNHGELIKFKNDEERYRITTMAEMFAERTAAKISKRKGVEIKKQDVGFVPVAGEERNRLVDKVLKGKYEVPCRKGAEVSANAEKDNMIGQAAVALKLNGSYTTGGSRQVLEMLRDMWPAQATQVRKPNAAR